MNGITWRSACILVVVASLLAGCASASPAQGSNASAGLQTASPTQALAVAATQAPKATELPQGSVLINGAGGTFPLPVYTEWTYAYQYVDQSVVVNYQGIGSGGGKKGIIDGTIDFAGSDSLLSDQEYAAGKDLQMYPMLAGAVVPVYNIKWSKAFAAGTNPPALTLDRSTLVGIYNASITRWDDPALVALNPGLQGYLPASPITAVHRSDGSGTTEIFTKALASFSPQWTAGGASSVQWPVDKAGNGIGGKGNQGVAAAVINTPNSIGYVELSFAIANSLPAPSLVNKAGSTVVANAASLASAMQDFAGGFSDKLTVTILDAPGKGSWPIAGYTYIILHTQSMSDCVKAGKLLQFLHWALTDPGAAAKAGALGYSVLPESVRNAVLAKYGEVTCKGQSLIK